MPACEACYAAKVRCDLVQQATAADPSTASADCSRCRRMKLECIPRVSRQGQGPKKRKRKTDNNACTSAAGDGLVQQSEDGRALVDVLGATQNHQHHHYGVRYLVHAWISFAFSRRSFSLLSRASRLAAKCGISMDDVFSNQRKSVLDSLMFQQQQHSLEETKVPLKWSDLPVALREVCSVDVNDPASYENRYIWIREAKSGHSRFLVSPAFEKDIASLWLLEQTWARNERPVFQIFLEGPADFDKFTKVIGYCIGKYTQPNIPPDPLHLQGFHIKMASGTVHKMDLVHTFEIVTLEHSFYLAELLLEPTSTATVNSKETSNSQQQQQQQLPSLATSDTDDSPAAKKRARDDNDGSSPLLRSSFNGDLEELTIDPDLEQLLGIINDTDRL